MKEKKRNWLFSINTKISALILASALCIATGISVFTYFHLGTTLDKFATEEMNLFCADKGTEYDAMLSSVESSVKSLSNFVAREAGSADDLKNSQAHRESVLSRIESLLLFTCEEIPNSNDVYFHYTVDITGEGNLEEGMFYSRNESGSFSELPITQIQRATEEADTIWYTTPLEEGHALWMEPHYDGSIKDVMLSYVTPVYCGDDVIAVLGIDINFHDFLDEIDQIKYKSSGYMYLKSGDGKIHYHPESTNEEHHGDEADLIISNEELMNSEKTDNKVIHYRYNDLDRVMVFVTLRNGMKLILCDSYDEIFEARDSAINTMVLITMGFALLFVAVSAIIAHRINSPLRQLARVARSLSTNVNSKVEFPKAGKDEVGDLTRALELGLSELQSQHALLESMAYYDHLTKVRNSASYSKTIEALDQDIKSGAANFGVVMLDVNFLKEVNDHYGHATGDIVLTRCAEVISEAFADDEVYRVGGDEFVVILRGDRIKQAESCLSFLDRLIEYNNDKADKAFMKISISYGMAVYEKKDYNYEAVYRRADRKMYDMKRKIHANRRKKSNKDN